MKNNTISLYKSIFGLKCPRCRSGELFTRKGLIVFGELLKMPKECSNCKLHYDMEPGFWLGSLWTSYPIVVLIEVPFLFAALFADGMMVWGYFTMMIVAFLIAWPLMLRLGRSIWIHLNVRYQS
ncbi:MAG: DUF983 domain-containing protein [Flavobacteriales bacterium]